MQQVVDLQDDRRENAVEAKERKLRYSANSRSPEDNTAELFDQSTDDTDETETETSVANFTTRGGNSVESGDSAGNEGESTKPYVPRYYKHSIVSPLYHRKKAKQSAEEFDDNEETEGPEETVDSGEIDQTEETTTCEPFDEAKKTEEPEKIDDAKEHEKFDETEETVGYEGTEESEEDVGAEEAEETEDKPLNDENSSLSYDSDEVVYDGYKLEIEDVRSDEVNAPWRLADENRPNLFECSEDEDMDFESNLQSSLSNGDETAERYRETRKRDHEESENPLVRSLKKARVKSNKYTRQRYTAVLEHFPVDLSFCGDSKILAVGTLRGDIILYHYSRKNGLVRVQEHTVHVDSLSLVEFSKDNRSIISCGDDNKLAISDAETGNLLSYINYTDCDGFTALAMISKNTFATADISGVVKLWDKRKKNWALKWCPQEEETVNFMITDDKKKVLTSLLTSGRAVAYDFRNKKKVSETDEDQPYKGDFTCGNFFMDNTKFAVGTNFGSILTYNWCKFENWTNEIPYGYRKKRVSMNCMIPVTEKIGIFGMDDGFIRATSVFPSGQFGIVGIHGKSIEALDISHTGNFIGSVADDKLVRIWDVGYFSSMECFSQCKGPSFNEKMMQLHLPSSEGYNSNDFYAEMEMEDE